MLVRPRPSEDTFSSAETGSGDSEDFEIDFEDKSSPSEDEESSVAVNLDLKITVEDDAILVDWAIESSRDFMILNYFLLDGKSFYNRFYRRPAS